MQSFKTDHNEQTSEEYNLKILTSATPVIATERQDPPIIIPFRSNVKKRKRYLMSNPTIIEKRLNFSFVIPGRLAGMAMPGLNNPLEEEVGFLQRQKVKVLLNLGDMEYFYDDYRRLFQVVDEPMPEFSLPSMQQMERIMRFFMILDQDVAMGVHCAGGVGRTGTVLACLYGKVNEVSGYEAIKVIRELRPRSIESASQEKFILQYMARGV